LVDLRPYRVPSADSVHFGRWTRPDREDEPLPDHLEGWDPLNDVVIERVVTADLDGIRRDCGLSQDSELTLTASWVNQQSGMAELGYRHPLRPEQSIRVQMQSERLGGSLVLRTTISIARTDPSRGLGVARWAGSVLASHEQLLVLEGSGPMMPIADVDLAKTRFGEEASWALQLDDDLEAPVLGRLLLLVNSKDSELLRALSAAKPDARQTALIDELEAGVAADLFRAALALRDDLSSNEWAQGSIGELLSGFLGRARRGAALRTIEAGDDGALTAAIASSVRAAGFGRTFE
jgi:hypothetical protein